MKLIQLAMIKHKDILKIIFSEDVVCIMQPAWTDWFYALYTRNSRFIFKSNNALEVIKFIENIANHRVATPRALKFNSKAFTPHLGWGMRR